MGKGVVKAPKKISKRAQAIARDLIGIDRVKAGGQWDADGRLCALWAWLPVSCPRTKGNAKRAFVGHGAAGKAFARVASPEGQEEHQAALVSLMERALVTVLAGRLPDLRDSSTLPRWADARRSLVVVLPLPRSGVAETVRPSRKATLMIAHEPRRQPKVGDLNGYAKMVDDALEGAGWIDDDVAITGDEARKRWVGAPSVMVEFPAWRSMSPAMAASEPGYLVGLERLS